MSQQHTKRQPHNNTSSIFLLFEDENMYQNVVEYLNPTELYTFTLSYASVCDGPILTTYTVVKNALFNGNKHIKTRMERIYAQVIANTIFIPKPIRLLSLLTMKYCECCNMQPINFVTDYGLALCLPCKKENTSRIEMKATKLLRSKIEINDIIQNQKVNLVPHHCVKEQPNLGYYSRRLLVYYVLNEPFFDENNNRVGPIITHKQLSEMLNLPSYEAVEKYIEDNSPDQSQARCMFIQAMTLLREKVFDINEKKALERSVNVKRFRFKRFLNTTQAIALLLKRIPEHLRFKLDYRIQFSFYRQNDEARRAKMDGLRVLANAAESPAAAVQAVLNHGPPDGVVSIWIRCNRTAGIIKPLLSCPTKYNDETKKSHRANLLELARMICKHFKAPYDSEFPATCSHMVPGSL